MCRSIETTSWEPCAIFSDKPTCERFALIILNRALQLPVSTYNKLWSNAVYVVAADGGANHLHTLNTSSPSANLHLDLIIGDLDSLLPETRAHWEGKDVLIKYDSDQNSTDFAKAVSYIRNIYDQKPLDIVVLGDLGGRVDQAVSLLHHLFTLQEEAGYASGRLYLLSSESITFMLQSGRHVVKVGQAYNGLRIKKHVGIIPLKEASIISTSGLEWDVQNWETKFGGQVSTSNHVVRDLISIQTSNDVLFTIDLDVPYE